MYKPDVKVLDKVDKNLFTCELEVMLLDDLYAYPEERNTPFGTLGLLDMIVVVERLLDTKRLQDMDSAKAGNYHIMYGEVLNIMSDIADWEKITVDTGSIPLCKQVFKRLKGLHSESRSGE